MRTLLVFIFSLLLGFMLPVHAQLNSVDSAKIVQILDGRRLSYKKITDSSSLQTIAGNVKLKQGTSIFYCDSCVINNQSKIFEAYGHVHINDSDTTDIYSDYLRYFTDKRQAYLKGNVKLTDGHATLTTPDLNYDMVTNIGIYTNTGKVVNGKSVLTSKEGEYYAGLRDVYFKKNVELKDPAYYLKADSLQYNTELQTARFIAKTYLRDSSGRVMRTTEGTYELRTGKAIFTKRTTIENGSTIISGDQIAKDDSTGVAQIRGQGVLRDTAQGFVILANEIFANKNTEAYLATVKPLMIIKQGKDSIYVTADTLFSARLSDLKKNTNVSINDTSSSPAQDSVMARDTGMTAQVASASSVPKDSVARSDTFKIADAHIKANAGTAIDTSATKKSMASGVNISHNAAVKADSIKVQPAVAAAQRNSLKKNASVRKDDTNKSDSTDRYFEAFRHVRIFSDSVQSVCDSLFYSFKDSTFRLYQNPIIWSKGSQITGDTILLFTKNKKANRAKVFENSFLINELQEGIYNQVKATRLDAFFTEGNMDSVRAKGSTESIYFLQDEDSAYSGINEAASDIIDVYFKENQLIKIVPRSSVKGTIWPIKQKQPSEMRLPKFEWLEARRPKTKYELFE